MRARIRGSSRRRSRRARAENTTGASANAPTIADSRGVAGCPDGPSTDERLAVSFPEPVTAQQVRHEVERPERLMSGYRALRTGRPGERAHQPRRVDYRKGGSVGDPDQVLLCADKNCDGNHVGEHEEALQEKRDDIAILNYLRTQVELMTPNR